MSILKKIILILVSKTPNNGGSDKTSLSDEELVAQIVKANNTLLFGILYDRFSKKVYNKCIAFVKNEADAKDLTQDIFLKLFVKLSSFTGQSKFSTWLYSFTYNFCVNYVNRDKEKKLGDISDSIEDHDFYLSGMDDVDERDLYELKVGKLEQALEIIDPADKAILLLKYQDDVSIKDLGVLLEAGESAIKMRLKRAKIKVIEAHNAIK